ncbi:class I adenylate-forming enzyme family protein [Micromonospora sp. WMMD1128]|uniref:class I adenylate-forming enzyme family protein n=1 Tax=Micromonospora sp. WMMD1128 TaxID=3015150 RepID=UPI00248C6B7F|nr:class I adenylate-forming enzyme family protein [Micromonospora sp. WMMD1128]WBB76014.1 class I adenylate-forming enzyme family protein [Micromonospora sp. WMMD1128]
MGADNFRATLAADQELGAGNVLLRLAEHGADMRMPRVTFDVDVDGIPAWTPLSLATLTERVAARAAWFAARGIGRRDPVAVYVTSAPDVFLTFLALTWLGAIPALMNGNMPVELAAEFVRRLRGVGVVVDADHAALREHDLGVPILGDAAETGAGDPAQAPPHHRHHPEDPVAITHSSGTTRVPAAIVHSHHGLFAAIRAVRLTESRPYGEVRELSALPAAHAAGIITLNQALCNGYQLLCLSAQGGPFARSAETILDAIERWRPTGVFGFAVTWSELARVDLSTRDLSSVRNWFNTGDCAHESHVRRLVAVGSHPTWTRDGMVDVPGSKFVDMLGSTEMGHGAFRITHRLGSDRYDRCVGKPYPFAEIALLDVRTGEEVPEGQVGHVGLKSPTLAIGYWNDSVTTWRTRLNGYYLTGDLMYRDPNGDYHHVDRASDAVDLGDGAWLYTALSEERILAHCPDVRDCTVVAATADGGGTVTDVLLLLADDSDPTLDRTERVRAALGPAVAATLRRVVTVPEDGVVMGPTGKVRKFLMRQRLLADAGAPAAG